MFVLLVTSQLLIFGKFRIPNKENQTQEQTRSGFMSKSQILPQFHTGLQGLPTMLPAHGLTLINCSFSWATWGCLVLCYFYEDLTAPDKGPFFAI